MSPNLTVLDSIFRVKVLTDVASCFRWMSSSTEQGTVCGTERSDITLTASCVGGTQEAEDALTAIQKVRAPSAVSALDCPHSACGVPVSATNLI